MYGLRTVMKIKQMFPPPLFRIFQVHIFVTYRYTFIFLKRGSFLINLCENKHVHVYHPK